ncbi:acetylornithine deacetylase/succinyldiaminopimelate desuccinylase-like deacylase [Lophium mytilinum]|uniref:Acetylornithine deacetylase/succinyldiaminopimelate desuccinylase-like deacylase n=1 Tax=Lophium mytilinum TaxID=390894 RepID=A0A6A6RA24_9PEZI|nr:acetylornithine deacetylase/succinyldiaminopimelate desuccinylase-like deacylase [Lophium mytilinum]
MATKHEILSEIDANFPQYLNFLQTLIRAASPSPPGDTTEAASVVLDFLSSHGISADTVAPQSHMPNIVTDFDGGDKSGPRVVLNGHIDTYPVENPDKWKYGGPYSGHNDEVQIHGRGGVDMKAGTAASIIAYILLKKRAQKLKGSVALTVVSDEETGGKWGTRYLLEQGGKASPWRGDCVINGEPGGLQSIRFGEKGTLRLTFTVRTKGGNGAFRQLSRGANIVAAQLIQRLLEIESMTPHLPEELRKHFDNPEVRLAADEIMGPGTAEILLATTVNVGTIRGGLKVNVIPEECVFEADIRLPIGLLAEEVLDHIFSILKDFPEASVSKQEAASNPANYCSVDHPFAKHIADTTEGITGRRPVQLAGLGGTDCKFYRYLGIPAYVIGPSPHSMGASGEAVDIPEFKALIKIHTLAIWNYLGGET